MYDTAQHEIYVTVTTSEINLRVSNEGNHSLSFTHSGFYLHIPVSMLQLDMVPTVPNLDKTVLGHHKNLHSV